MKKISIAVLVSMLLIFPSISSAEGNMIVMLGAGGNVFTSFARPDGGGDFTLNARF